MSIERFILLESDLTTKPQTTRYISKESYYSRSFYEFSEPTVLTGKIRSNVFSSDQCRYQTYLEYYILGKSLVLWVGKMSVKRSLWTNVNQTGLIRNLSWGPERADSQFVLYIICISFMIDKEYTSHLTMMTRLLMSGSCFVGSCFLFNDSMKLNINRFCLQTKVGL